jgi:chromosome segregation ATPase
VHYFKASEKIYQITNQTDRPKVLYIEYPIISGWQLTDDSPKPDYATQRYYRFRVKLESFEEKEIKIGVRQPLMDSYQLTTLSRADLELFVLRRYINEATRSQINSLIDLRENINRLESKLESFDDEVDKIEADQKRLRENIEALAKTPEAKTLIARYIAKAGEQETKLEEMEKERKSLEADKQRLEAELATAIRNFEVK